MATLRRNFPVDAPVDAVWSALRDVYQVHHRLAAGFVTDCRDDHEGARIVSFANGVTARELIISVDDPGRRVVYSSVGGRLTHHNAAAQVFPEGDGRSRIEWIVDLLPEAMAAPIGAMMDEGVLAMQRTLSGARAG
jgi:carbon monoxide dehydrogenase subunit G